MASSAREIAGAFVAARREARALPGFPGEPPATSTPAMRSRTRRSRFGQMRSRAGRSAACRRIRSPSSAPNGSPGRSSNTLSGAPTARRSRFPVLRETASPRWKPSTCCASRKDVPPEDTEWTREDAADLIGGDACRRGNRRQPARHHQRSRRHRRRLRLRQQSRPHPRRRSAELARQARTRPDAARPSSKANRSARQRERARTIRSMRWCFCSRHLARRGTHAEGRAACLHRRGHRRARHPHRPTFARELQRLRRYPLSRR